MTTSWLIVPVVVPALTAAFIVLALRHNLNHQRVLSVVATMAQFAVAIGLYLLATDGETRAYLLGNWPAPFGIVLVLDRLSATMVLLSATLAFVVILAALGRWDRRGRHFHALFQFQSLGINGAFLTGDIFNLFVFFEVLLIASYGLMLHGGGAIRLQAGFRYVAINLFGSTVFLFAIGIIYATTGTLNMADLAVKVPQVVEADQALLAAGALMLLAVFGIKSAMVPLHWWLPPTYGSTSPPAAALFAILTKVGAYSIIRVYSLIFGGEAVALAAIATPWVLPAGVLTLVLGTVGVLASRRLVDLVSYSLVASMGTILIAIGLNSSEGLSAALYYAVQSTVVSAALFLLAGILSQDPECRTPLAPPTMPYAGMYFLLAIAMVGMPPLAGFIGKLLILDAALETPSAAVIWSTILVTSLLLIVGFARMGIRIFWAGASVRSKGKALNDGMPPPPTVPTLAICLMIAVVAALSVFAGPVMRDMTATANQLLAPKGYIETVLGAGVLPASARE